MTDLVQDLFDPGEESPRESVAEKQDSELCRVCGDPNFSLKSDRCITCRITHAY